MTRTERALRNRLLALGLLLTLAVIALDGVGVLLPLEHALSDRRARWCQFFIPPPTDKLVHLDIDDPSLEFIGKWPWPREKFAELMDEIRLAGAKAVAWDVIFPDVAEQSDSDAEFAAAIRRFGNVLISVSFDPSDLFQPVTTTQKAILAELVKDPALSEAEASEALKSQGLAEATSDDYLTFLHQAIARRVSDAMRVGNPSLLDLRHLLFPKLNPEITSSIQLHFLAEEYQRQISMRQLAALGRPITPGVPPLLDVESQSPPIPALSAAAGHTGYINDFPIEGSTLRSVPLFVRCDDRLYPMLGLSLACAYLGVDLSSVQIAPDAVTIPTPDGQAVIPVRTDSGSIHGAIGTLMDVPWFGRSGSDQWRTMYDFPAHLTPRQHLPISLAWDPCQTRQAIANNNRNADDAIAEILVYLDGDSKRADAYLAHRPDIADALTRRKRAEELLPQVESDIGDPTAIRLDTLKPDERRLVESVLALKAGVDEGKSLEEQLAGQEATLHAALDGKAVLIGSTATGAADVRPTPLYDQCPGAVVHGAIFNAILTRFTFRRASLWVNWGLTLLVGCIATAAGIWLSPPKGLLASVGLVVGYLAINGEVFYDFSHVIVGAAGPMAAAAAVWALLILVRIIAEQAARARITERFSSYVDPALVNYVIENPDKIRLDGQVKELSVVFTDLEGFSTMTEKLQEHSIGVLNEYLDMMTGIIRTHSGYVNKFLGDGIMFFYGAPRENPNHADDAVVTVLEMHGAMKAFNRDLESRGLPAFRMRAGVSTGKMVVGDAGGAGACDYTVLGDLVNLGARLESANKQFGSQTLISEKTAIKISGRFLMRPIGRIQVKGKTKVVMAYEVLASIGDATERQKELTTMTEVMVDAFITSDFSGCAAAADRLDAAFGKNRLTDLYRSLSAVYLKDPPGYFDGSIVLETK